MGLRHPKARFAVIGQPVDHSLSPFIHKLFARQWTVDLDYRAIALAPENLAAGLAALAAEGAHGLNVTLPHKQSVIALCGALSERARRAQAVNTLTAVDGNWQGDNTDGIGLVNDLTQRQGIDLRGRRTLLLGAGGAAYGVAPALLDAGIGELVVCNRSPEKADDLVDALADPARVHTRYWQDLDELAHFDLIINATSAGRGTQPLKLPFHLGARQTVAVDLGYGRAAIDFLAWAKAAECGHTLDGLGMLVEQAAESFYLWQGVRPETDDVYRQLRKAADGEGASE
ncbi:MAG TPA: shikimate dehydrogenase [Arenimonas sp.]|nr:shikimate dehydrogenase [Arenimonas sp.]